MHEQLRIAIGNARETFGALGKRLLRNGENASAGAAFAVDAWLAAFVPTDKGETAALPPFEPSTSKDLKPAKAQGKKRGRKPKAAKADPELASMLGRAAATEGPSFRDGFVGAGANGAGVLAPKPEPFDD